MKRFLATNVLWNWGGTLTQLLVGFVVMRFLVRELGATVYGLWILIGAFTGYFNVFDLGVAASVARNLAFCQSRNDVLGVNRLVNTALAIFACVAALILAGVVGAWFVFFRIIDVPPELTDSVRDALLLVGVNLALSFPVAVFTGVLWSNNRFDLINKVEIPTVLTRAVLTVWVIDAGGGLRALALITLALTVAQGLVKTVLAFRLVPDLCIHARYCDKETAKGLYGFGIWYFLLCLSQNILPQISPTVVGSRLGAAFVTALRIPMQLTTYAHGFLNSGAQVLAPLATAHHARQDTERQRALVLEGGKFTLMLSVVFVTLFAFLGEPLITLWLGPQYAYTWVYLMILSLGELLPMSQWASYSVIIGMGKHRMMALLSLTEIAASVTLLFLLVEPFGLPGVCVAAAAPGLITRGVCQLAYCCRLVNVSVGTYLCHTFLPTLALAAPSTAALWIGTSLVDIDRWWKLFAAGALYGIVVLATAGVGLVGWEQTKTLLGLGKQPKSPPPENPRELVSAGETAS